MIAYLNRKWIKTHFQVQLLAAEVISLNQSLDLDIACAEVATKNTTAQEAQSQCTFCHRFLQSPCSPFYSFSSERQTKQLKLLRVELFVWQKHLVTLLL